VFFFTPKTQLQHQTIQVIFNDLVEDYKKNSVEYHPLKVIASKRHNDASKSFPHSLYCDEKEWMALDSDNNPMKFGGQLLKGVITTTNLLAPGTFVSGVWCQSPNIQIGIRASKKEMMWKDINEISYPDLEILKNFLPFEVKIDEKNKNASIHLPKNNIRQHIIPLACWNFLAGQISYSVLPRDRCKLFSICINKTNDDLEFGVLYKPPNRKGEKVRITMTFNEMVTKYKIWEIILDSLFSKIACRRYKNTDTYVWCGFDVDGKTILMKGELQQDDKKDLYFRGIRVVTENEVEVFGIDKKDETKREWYKINTLGKNHMKELDMITTILPRNVSLHHSNTVWVEFRPDKKFSHTQKINLFGEQETAHVLSTMRLKRKKEEENGKQEKEEEDATQSSVSSLYDEFSQQIDSVIENQSDENKSLKLEIEKLKTENEKLKTENLKCEEIIKSTIEKIKKRKSEKQSG
jgi:hypothetical protein